MRDYAAMADGYEAGVTGGEIPACRWVRLACERNGRDRQRTDAGWPYVYRPDLGAKACTAIELLCHTKGKLAGTPIRLEPWQAWIVMTVFGWRRKADLMRRFRTSYIEVPRKNGKSLLTAAIALYAFAACGEKGPEVYSLANAHDQAAIVFGIARRMAKLSPGFCAKFGVTVNAHDLSLPDGGIFRALSADASTLDGLNISFASVDELHAHQNRAVWDVTETATGARDEPLIWAITTAGVDTAGICYEQRQYVTKLLDAAAVDETYFGVIYTIDESDLTVWDTEAVWRKANPNFGVSVRADDFERLAAKARALPSARNNFLTKRLDVWVRAASPWMPMDAWHACGASFALDEFKDCRAWIGLDIGERRDVCAVVTVIERDGLHYVVPRLYLPESAIREGRNSQYEGWARDGHLMVTPGNTTDYATIEAEIERICSVCVVQAVPHDPNQARQLSQNLLERGVPMLEMRQWAVVYDPAMRDTEAAVVNRTLRHDSNPCMTWMMSNVVAKPNAKNQLFPRKDRPEHKIDGPVALLMAVNKALAPVVAEAAPGVSVFSY